MAFPKNIKIDVYRSMSYSKRNTLESQISTDEKLYKRYKHNTPSYYNSIVQYYTSIIVYIDIVNKIY